MILCTCDLESLKLYDCLLKYLAFIKADLKRHNTENERAAAKASMASFNSASSSSLSNVFYTQNT